MERLSGLLVFYETLFADGFQLILQIYIILSDSERRVDWRQVLSMLSSLVTVSKASIGLLLIQTNKSNPRSIEEFLNPENLNDDSLLDGKSIPQKLKLIAQFFPALLFFQTLILLVSPSFALFSKSTMPSFLSQLQQRICSSWGQSLSFSSQGPGTEGRQDGCSLGSRKYMWLGINQANNCHLIVKIFYCEEIYCHWYFCVFF